MLLLAACCCFCCCLANLCPHLQQVDMVMIRCFEELSSEDVDDDPLVQLSCGHLLTRSSLDGVIGLNRWAGTLAYCTVLGSAGARVH